MEKYVKTIKENILFVETIDNFKKLLLTFEEVKQGK